jgi:hypothetical protein
MLSATFISQKGALLMPALKCPHCGFSDLHAVDVETVRVEPSSPNGLKRSHQHELACKKCGWTPSASLKPDQVLKVKPLDSNV